MTPVCPFVKAARPEDSQGKKPHKDSASIGPKCPFGYDSQTFKLGPFSCILCQSLLFDSTRCMPCTHVFCKVCISRFKDCPLCGADIESTEADINLQSTVDRFIDGHARIKRPQVESAEKEDVGENKTVTYGDVSLERGSFLVQQAIMAFRAQNVESAKARFIICAEDIREQISKLGKTSELCSQLGAVLGLLGDCCRAMGEATSAVTYFEESVEFVSQLPRDDTEITHTLSVSLNKIGDLKYYDGDLRAARSYYHRSLNVRRDAIKNKTDVPSQILDVAVSLAKVADVDRSLGNEDIAIEGFQEGIKMLESLNLKPEETALVHRQKQVLEFINGQLVQK